MKRLLFSRGSCRKQTQQLSHLCDFHEAGGVFPGVALCPHIMCLQPRCEVWTQRNPSRHGALSLFKAEWEIVHVSSTAEASPRTRGNGTDLVHVCARRHADVKHPPPPLPSGASCSEPLSILESLVHFPQHHSSCRERW